MIGMAMNGKRKNQSHCENSNLGSAGAQPSPELTFGSFFSETSSELLTHIDISIFYFESSIFDTFTRFDFFFFASIYRTRVCCFSDIRIR